MPQTPRGYAEMDLLGDQQKEIFNTLLQALMGQLGGEGQDILGAPLMREFQEKTVPGLAERFAGLGAGSQSSSAFQQALGSSSADLQERLAQLGMQQKQSALGGLQGLLGTPTRGLVEKAKPWWQELLGSLSGGLGQVLGTAATGGLGNILGGLRNKMPQGAFSSTDSRQTFYPR